MALALLVGFACGRDGSPEAGRPAGDPTEREEGHAVRPIEVEITTDRDVYAPGDPLRLTLVARNASDEAVELGFTSGQRYDFRIEEPDGRSVWTWSAAQGFMQVLGSETFEAGEERSWTETADVRLEPGSYVAVGMVTNRDGPLTGRTDLTVR